MSNAKCIRIFIKCNVNMKYIGFLKNQFWAHLTHFHSLFWNVGAGNASHLKWSDYKENCERNLQWS